MEHSIVVGIAGRILKPQLIMDIILRRVGLQQKKSKVSFSFMTAPWNVCLGREFFCVMPHELFTITFNFLKMIVWGLISTFCCLWWLFSVSVLSVRWFIFTLFRAVWFWAGGKPQEVSHSSWNWRLSRAPKLVFSLSTLSRRGNRPESSLSLR